MEVDKLFDEPINMARVEEVSDKVEATDFEVSAKRLKELKANRHVDDIPLSDEYWVALTKHTSAFK